MALVLRDLAGPAASSSTFDVPSTTTASFNMTVFTNWLLLPTPDM
jgi:hypothetical protein